MADPLHQACAPGEGRAEQSCDVPIAPDAPGGAQLLGRALAFSAAFFVAAEAGRFLSQGITTYVSFWLPAGLFLAVLLVHATRTWPVFVLAALPANLAFDLLHGTAWLTTLGFYAANTLEALTAAWLVRRFVAPRPALDSLRELLGFFVCAAVLGPLVGAGAGATVLAATGLEASFLTAWRTWWSSEAMAILLVAPCALVWSSRLRAPGVAAPPARVHARCGWRCEACLLGLALVAGTGWVVAGTAGVAAPGTSVLELLVLWAAVRFGLRGATAASLLLATTMAVVAARAGPGVDVADMQLFLTVTAVIGLLTAVVLAERNRSWRAVRDSEERFRLLTEASFEGIFITEHGRILDANDQGFRLLGVDRAATIGRAVADFVHPTSRPVVEAAMRSDRITAYEHRLVRADGSMVLVEAQARMVRRGDRLVRLTAVRDITQRRRHEDVLLAAGRHLRRVLDTLPAAAYTCDPEGLITYFNPRAEALWGRAPRLHDPSDRYCGSHRLWSRDGDLVAHAQCAMAVALTQRRALPGRELVIERPDGTRRIVVAHASPLVDDGGVGRGAVNVLIDVTDDRLAEKARDATKELLHQFIRYTPAAVAMFDRDMRYLQASERWLSDYHLDGQAIIGRSHYDVFPDIPERWKEVHRRVLGGAVERCDEDCFERADGQREWLQWEVRPWHTPAGEVGGLIMFTQVITARKAVDAALRESRAKLVLAMDMAQLGHWEYDVASKRFTGDGGVFRLYGAPRAPACGTSMAMDDYFRRFVHPDDSERARAELAVAIATTDPQYTRQFEHGILRLDGRPRIVQTRIAVLHDAAGRTTRIFGVNQDVTEQKRTEQALRENQAKFVLAMDMARLGHWEFDVATAEFTFEDSFYRLLRTSAAQEGGRRMNARRYAEKFLPPEEMILVAEEIDRAVRATDPDFTRQLEHRFRRADGTMGHMSVRFAIVQDATGRTIRTYGVNQDITEQKRAEQQRLKLEEQLRQAQKLEAIGTLAGGIAHDFNNLLTGIMGNLQLAELDLARHPALPLLQDAGKASRRARDLVSRILTFSRQGAHERAPAALGPIMQEALQLLRASLPPGIVIHEELAPDCPPVLCDAGQIHQVVMNLGVNATDAIGERGGVITVRLTHGAPDASFTERHPRVGPQHVVCLAVHDTGIGMSPEVRARIFEPFFTTKPAGKGTGLGLSMVHGIVQAHDGAIVVESGPLPGTTFRLFFPRSPVPAGEPKPSGMCLAGPAPGVLAPPEVRTPSAAAPTPAGGRILVVDDEVAVLRVAGLALRRRGFAADTFASGPEALAAFQREPAAFAAVVTDLTMPGMSGIELARALREIRPDVPVILASGRLPDDALREIKRMPAARLLEKPYSLDALVTEVAEAARSWAAAG